MVDELTPEAREALFEFLDSLPPPDQRSPGEIERAEAAARVYENLAAWTPAYTFALALDVGRRTDEFLYYIGRGDEIVPIREDEIEEALERAGIKITTIRLSARDSITADELRSVLEKTPKVERERPQPDYLQHDPTKRHRRRREPRGHRYARKGFWA